MPGVTKEQIEKAKEWDLLSYLQIYEPRELKRSGPNEYCTRTHDSLKISHGKRSAFCALHCVEYGTIL